MQMQERKGLLAGPVEAARRLGVTVKALRVYERQGLVRPRRSPQGWRIYTEADVERLSRALALKAMGFGLSQIAGLLDASPDEMAAALATQETRLIGERARLEKALGAVRDARRERVATALRLVA